MARRIPDDRLPQLIETATQGLHRARLPPHADGGHRRGARASRRARSISTSRARKRSSTSSCGYADDAASRSRRRRRCRSPRRKPGTTLRYVRERLARKQAPAGIAEGAHAPACRGRRPRSSKPSSASCYQHAERESPPHQARRPLGTGLPGARGALVRRARGAGLLALLDAVSPTIASSEEAVRRSPIVERPRASSSRRSSSGPCTDTGTPHPQDVERRGRRGDRRRTSSSAR